MNRLTQTLLALGALAVPAQAAVTATYLGTEANMTDWRTPGGTTKTYDPDGDNILGTEGYHLFGADGQNATWPGTGDGGVNDFLAALPSYLSVTKNVSAEVQYNGYALIDNPVDGTPAMILSGTSAQNLKVPTLIATVGFAGTVPSDDLVMTLMHDNLDAIDLNVASYQIRASDGTTILASVSSLTANQVPDWHSFQLSGMTAGDSVQIWGTAPGTATRDRSTTLGGITFDVVPEPSATLIGAFGVLAILRRRRS
jgi:hypothetical protein